jgi:preprotein translocase subunit Sec63
MSIRDGQSTSAADDIGAVDLEAIYSQVENGQDAYGVLGSYPDHSDDEIRARYLQLARSLHPDKAPFLELRNLHNSLF